MDITTITTILGSNRVDPGSFGSRCCALRCTHMSADTIRLPCIRLVLPLTLSWPSGFAPRARLIIGVSLCLLRLTVDFSCDCMFGGERRGGLTGQPVGPLVGAATMTVVMRSSRVDSGSFSSRCCTFRRTHTSADPIRLLLCI